jgi:hypothetical protein
LREGRYSAQISRQLKIPETTCNDHIKRLLAYGFIKVDVKDIAIFYKLTKKGADFIRDYRLRISRYGGEQGKTRLHRLNVKFNILEDNPTAHFETEHEMNNWIQKYTRLTFPIGITLQKNPKSVVALFHEFETDKSQTFTDFFSHVMRGVYYVYQYLMKKHQIKTDIFDLEVVSQEIANERPDLDGKLDNKKITTLGLNRTAKSFFKADFKGKSWLDYSKGMPELETNDLLYEERLLMMPETIQAINDNFTPALNELTEQIRLHLEVQRETLEVLKEMKGFFKKK